MNKFIGDRHVLSLSDQNRYISRNDILRFAEQNDIRNAASILESVQDAVGSFQAIASEIGIKEPVRSLILSHIKSHTP